MSFGSATPPVGRRRAIVSPRTYVIGSMLCRTRVQTISHRPRVVCIEWLSPLYVAGHWVPEMVQLAGGQDVLAQPGSPSRVVTWDEVQAAAPDVLIVMPCGFSVEQTQTELFQMMQQPGQWQLSSALAERTLPGRRLLLFQSARPSIDRRHRTLGGHPAPVRPRPHS